MFPELIGQFNPIYFESIGSTNDFAKKELANNSNPFVVIADQQTSGHGKMTRDFYSPKDSGIYLTYAYPLKNHTFEISDLPTIKAGVSVAQTLEKLTGKSFRLKWVNDVIYQDKKVAGILAEKTANGLVIGIGINLSRPDVIPEDIKDIATWIYDEPIAIQERQDLVVELTRQMSTNNAEDLIETYTKYSSLLNHKVELQIGTKTTIGTVTGFDNRGGIIIDGNQSYTSGEVTKVYEK
jgi:BirA family biotin operon repressor/biotin-[acetyl-CoA-carboxylase] ligase